MMQTYGKKKAGGRSATGKSHRDLFGGDEIGLEKQLADLSLQTAQQIADTPREEKKDEPGEKTGRDGHEAAAPTDTKPSLISQEDADAIRPLLTLSEGNLELFTTFGMKLAKSFNIEKIGEGSFAEVFKLSAKPSPSSQSQSQSQTQPVQVPAGGAIIKIIPLKHPTSDPLIADRTSAISSVEREIKVFRTLDSIHGFTRFRGMRLVTGAWARPFLTAFRKFRTRNRNRALNRAPDDDFLESQIYAVVEMGDAGSEIFLIKRPSAFQVYDIFWSSVILFANAEEQIEFEHRDLHLSNICVEPHEKSSDGTEEVYEYDEEATEPPHLDIDPELLQSMSDLPEHRLGLSNLKVTVIDYTISRCRLTPAASSSDSATRPEIAYDPMSFVSPDPTTSPDDDDDDPHLESTNKEDALQFRTYRKTRAVALHHHQSTNTDTDNNNTDKWSPFLPQTNVIWLAYLLTALRRRAQARIARANWPTRPYILKGSSDAARQMQQMLWRVLGEVEDVIGDRNRNRDGGGVVSEGEGGGKGGGGGDGGWTDDEIAGILGGARELLATGVQRGWVTQAEVEAFKSRLEGEQGEAVGEGDGEG